MLTQGEDVEAHALRQRGWSISAIARHLDRDRKTVRAYLNGDRQPGGGRRRRRIRWRGSSPICGPGSPMTVICGRRRCSTRSSCSATTGRIRRSSASSASGSCVRTARRAAG